MFNRKEYKVQALARLKGNWRINLLVSATILVLGWISNLPFSRYYYDSFQLYLIFTLLSIAIAGIAAMALAYFSIKFFKAGEAVSYGTFIEGMNLWLKGILATLWVSLWLFLWGLLFIIPGIVKSYSYSQIYFILAENPNLSVRKALQISKIITRGYKGELFVQDLSFFGWVILSLLTGSLGLVFLTPYYQGAKTHAYAYLKEQALSTGTLKASDFTDLN